MSAASVSCASRGSAAAAASRTMSTSLKPPWSVTDTDRSTPGSTLVYRAVSPVTVGAGNGNGSVKAMLVPSSWVRVASGPLPPPDSRTAFGVALGDSVPSAAAVSVASTGTQVPSRRTRTGSSDVVAVKVPSGSAWTVEISVVALSTGTAWPEATASARAAAIGSVSAVPAAAVAVGSATSAPASTTSGAGSRRSLRDGRPDGFRRMDGKWHHGTNPSSPRHSAASDL